MKPVSISISNTLNSTSRTILHQKLEYCHAASKLMTLLTKREIKSEADFINVNMDFMASRQICETITASDLLLVVNQKRYNKRLFFDSLAENEKKGLVLDVPNEKVNLNFAGELHSLVLLKKQHQSIDKIVLHRERNNNLDAQYATYAQHTGQSNPDAHIEINNFNLGIDIKHGNPQYASNSKIYETNRQNMSLLNKELDQPDYTKRLGDSLTALTKSLKDPKNATKEITPLLHNAETILNDTTLLFHEKIISAQEIILNIQCQNLSVPFTPSMLIFRPYTPRVDTNSNHNMHQYLTNDLLQSTIEKKNLLIKIANNLSKQEKHHLQLMKGKTWAPSFLDQINYD
jgi:hypothetical protein